MRAFTLTSVTRISAVEVASGRSCTPDNPASDLTQDPDAVAKRRDLPQGRTLQPSRIPRPVARARLCVSIIIILHRVSYYLRLFFQSRPGNIIRQFGTTIYIHNPGIQLKTKPLWYRRPPGRVRPGADVDLRNLRSHQEGAFRAHDYNA